MSDTGKFFRSQKKEPAFEEKLLLFILGFAQSVFPFDREKENIFGSILQNFFLKRAAEQTNNNAELSSYLNLLYQYRYKDKKQSGGTILSDFSRKKTYSNQSAVAETAVEMYLEAKIMAAFAHDFDDVHVTSKIYKFQTVIKWLIQELDENKNGIMFSFANQSLASKTKNYTTFKELCSLAENQLIGDRVKDLVHGIDYVDSDEFIPPTLIFTNGFRVLRVLSEAGLRKAGKDMDVCLKERKQHENGELTRVDQIDYENLLDKGISRFYVLVKGMRGEAKTLLQVDKPSYEGQLSSNGRPCRGVIVEASESRNSLVRFHMPFYSAFAEQNDLAFGTANYRTGMANTQRGWVPLYEIEEGDVVQGDLILRNRYGKDASNRDNVIHHGFIVNGCLDYSGSVVHIISGVSATSIAAVKCNNLEEIRSDVSADELIIDKCIKKIPERCGIERVKMLEYPVDPYDNSVIEHTLTWGEYYTKCMQYMQMTFGRTALPSANIG